VKQAAERVADAGGGGRWAYVSGHDPRWSWATYHLVERQVDVRTTMAVGLLSDRALPERTDREPDRRGVRREWLTGMSRRSQQFSTSSRGSVP
jgi:hypothetical protein